MLQVAHNVPFYGGEFLYVREGEFWVNCPPLELRVNEFFVTIVV